MYLQLRSVAVAMLTDLFVSLCFINVFDSVASCVQAVMELLRGQIRLDGRMWFVRCIYRKYVSVT